MSDPGADRAGLDQGEAVAVAAQVLGPRAERNRSLAPFCTYRVGGPAAVFIEVETVEDLVAVRRAVAVSGCPTLVVGRGSNLLVADTGFPGIVVHLGQGFEAVTIGDEPGDDGLVPVVAGGSALLPVVARKTAAAGLTGFEWAVGVPGSIGGAVRMNAGGHGSDMAADLAYAWVFDLAEGVDPCAVEHEDGDGSAGAPVQRVSADRLALTYRHSAIGSSQVVTQAELRLRPGEVDAATEEIGEIVRWRRQHQPGGQNAGSVFTNPEGDSAGRLIDQVGLKGFRVGTAQVSTKHANFIQADPDGSADDVYQLIREVQLRVATATGVELAVENRLVGFGAEAGS